MKKIMNMFLALILFSCEPVKKDKAYNDTFVESKIKSFIEDHPNWDQNEIIKDSINRVFIDSVLSWSKDPGFLNGLPLTLSDFEKSGDTMTAMGKVDYKSDRPDASMLNHIDFRAAFILTPEMVNKTQSNRAYNIYGRVVKLVSLPRGYLSALRDYDLGGYIFEVDSISNQVYY